MTTKKIQIQHKEMTDADRAHLEHLRARGFASTLSLLRDHKRLADETNSLSRQLGDTRQQVRAAIDERNKIDRQLSYIKRALTGAGVTVQGLLDTIAQLCGS